MQQCAFPTVTGVKRRDRLPAEARAGGRGRRLGVRPSISAALTPRNFLLPLVQGCLPEGAESYAKCPSAWNGTPERICCDRIGEDGTRERDIARPCVGSRCGARIARQHAGSAIRLHQAHGHSRAGRFPRLDEPHGAIHLMPLETPRAREHVTEFSYGLRVSVIRHPDAERRSHWARGRVLDASG